jgi:ribose transport system permease protein
VSDIAAGSRPRPLPFRISPAGWIALGSALAFVIIALATRQAAQLSWEGITGLLERMVALGITAIGQTVVIIAGSIDLSVAHLISVSAVLASYFMQGEPDRILVTVVAVLATAALVGLINGFLVARLAVNPLIATLGTGLILQGILSAAFNDFAGAVAKSFQGCAYGTIGPLPVSLLTFALLSAMATFVLRRTVFGAHLYAVGGNSAGARFAGIRTERVVMAAHIAASLLAGVTGLYLASRLGSGAPWVGESGLYDLESIAVVVIGGTLLSGGRGGIGGTLAGVFLFAVLDAGFNMIAVDPFLKQILRGAIVVAAVAAYTFRSKAYVG